MSSPARAERYDLDDLRRELLMEQLKFYRAANEERERQKRECEMDLFLTRRWGYPLPRRGRP